MVFMYKFQYGVNKFAKFQSSLIESHMLPID